MRIISVNVGVAIAAEWAGRLRRTAIDKQPAGDRVPVRPEGLAGDERADLKHHGSSDQAVYAYAREDYDWWQERLGRDLRNGRFGENLTTSGVDVNGAVIGERWRIGGTLLEVTGPRTPCVVFRNWMDEPGWVKRFTEAGRPGAYLRVVETGDVGAGDDVRIVARPEHGVTVSDWFLARHGDEDALRRVLTLPGHDPRRDERVARSPREPVRSAGQDEPAAAPAG
ncbi:6-N-hydroxylaminopurine resistance protein [Nonomuraea coxensis DSM 45129]|uniref:6-N-hydroxylaminopurine resistance protein n=1 Tax=Nonomuraea coxensis DSM 45129 TaxID=1122611 RepID=A0ABX8TWT5_9ACTN|nr:MOSC domain-containing protein [Nonomuraea coxensis]QYC39755.1 6-N-hydroxylaminopurine resistance protein [Nonomuraea coxensis DSM 45129]